MRERCWGRRGPLSGNARLGSPGLAPIVAKSRRQCCGISREMRADGAKTDAAACWGLAAWPGCTEQRSNDLIAALAEQHRDQGHVARRRAAYLAVRDSNYSRRPHFAFPLPSAPAEQRSTRPRRRLIRMSHLAECRPARPRREARIALATKARRGPCPWHAGSAVGLDCDKRRAGPRPSPAPAGPLPLPSTTWRRRGRAPPRPATRTPASGPAAFRSGLADGPDRPDARLRRRAGGAVLPTAILIADRGAAPRHRRHRRRPAARFLERGP